MNIGSFRSQPIIQQDLKRCRLRSVPHCSTVLFYLFAIIYAVLFCYYGLSMHRIHEFVMRYDDVCGNQTNCILEIDLPENFTAPIGLYYRLTNFYQLHRQIANSFSSMQLRGMVANTKDLAKCNPHTYINDTIHPANLYVPCGSLPAAVFNDTFSFLGFDGFSETEITLSMDRKVLYNAPAPEYTNSSNWLQDSGLFPRGVQDEHFISWMRQSAFSPFRKLYAFSQKKNLSATKYQISIKNNYPTSLFKGEKYIVISEIRFFGTNKDGPAYVFGFMCAMFLVAASILGVISWKRSKPSSKFHPDRIKTMFIDTTAN